MAPHKPVFFEGSVEEAITACSQAQKLLLVFLHGVNPESVTADVAIHRALQSQPRCVGLRLFDDLADNYPSNFTDAKHFRELVPTITALPAACILSPEGVILAEMEGAEVTEQVEQEMWKAQSSLPLHQIMGSSTDASPSPDSSRSSSFQQGFPRSQMDWQQGSPMSSAGGKFGLSNSQPNFGGGDSFFDQKRNGGLQLDLITSFPRNEAISMAEALAKASSQAAHVAAGHAWNQAQMPKQTATICSMPSTPKMPAMPQMRPSQSLGSGFSQSVGSFPSQAPQTASAASQSLGSASHFPGSLDQAHSQSLASDSSQNPHRSKASPSREQLLAHATQSLGAVPEEAEAFKPAIPEGISEHGVATQISAHTVQGPIPNSKSQALASSLQHANNAPSNLGAPSDGHTKGFQQASDKFLVGGSDVANQGPQIKQPEHPAVHADHTQVGPNHHLPVTSEPKASANRTAEEPGKTVKDDSYHVSSAHKGSGAVEHGYKGHSHLPSAEGHQGRSNQLKPFDESIMNPVSDESAGALPSDSKNVEKHEKPQIMYENEDVKNVEGTAQEPKVQDLGMSQESNGEPSFSKRFGDQDLAPPKETESASFGPDKPSSRSIDKAREVQDKAAVPSLSESSHSLEAETNAVRIGPTEGDRFLETGHGESEDSKEVDHRFDAGLRPTAVVNKYLELRARKGLPEQQIQPVIKDFPTSPRSHESNNTEQPNSSTQGGHSERPSDDQPKKMTGQQSDRESKAAPKATIAHEDHESAASELQSLLKPQVWYEEDELNPLVEQRRERPAQSVKTAAQNEAEGSQPHPSAADFLLNMSRAQDSQRTSLGQNSQAEYNNAQSPSYRPQSPSYRPQSPSYRPQSPSYKQGGSAFNQLVDAHSQTPLGQDSSPGRQAVSSERGALSSGRNQDSLTGFGARDSSIEKPADAAQAPPTPEKTLPKLRLSLPSPDTSKREAKHGAQIGQQSEVALPLTFRDMPDNEIAELYKAQIGHRESYDSPASTGSHKGPGRLSPQEQHLSNLLTGPEAELAQFRQNFPAQASLESDDKLRGREKNRIPRSPWKNASRKRTQQAYDAYGADQTGAEVAGVQSRRQSGQFRGFDLASHKHASPITSPRAIRGDLESASRFDFFKPGESAQEEGSSSSEGEQNLSKSHAVEDPPGQANHSAEIQTDRPLQKLPFESERTHASNSGVDTAPAEILRSGNPSTSESEISLSENLPDSRDSSPRSGPSQAEMESSETKKKLKQADIIPLPNRPRDEPTPQQAALSRAGMANVAVGSMSVYLGSLLVMMLGFLSGLFSAGASKLAVAAPESVRDTIAQPFYLATNQDQTANEAPAGSQKEVDHSLH